jgi:hypothetical protein
MRTLLHRSSPTGGARVRRPGVWVPLLFALLVAGCSSDEDEVRLYCPGVIVVKDAGQIVNFKGEGRDLTDVIYQADIGAAIVGCEFDEETIEAELAVRVRVGRGPAGEEPRAGFTYFVAIADAGRTIVAREEFDVDMALPENKTLIEKIDQVDYQLPVRPGESGREYMVFVGFVLSPDAYEYNKKNR